VAPELFAAGERQTLEFFFGRLKAVSGPDVDHQELLYNASVLAHHARVSTHSTTDLTTPASLVEVFDYFVLAMRHWNQLNSGDMGTMSRQWLAEYNAQHP